MASLSAVDQMMPDASASAAGSNAADGVEWEEEEEVEVVEIQSSSAGGSGADGAAPTASAPASAAVASTSAVSIYPPPSARRRAVAEHLRQLLRPCGPLAFSRALTAEPSLVPLPPQSIYPSATLRSERVGGPSAGVAGATFHHNNASNPNRKRGLEESSVQSADAYWASVRPVREHQPLMRAARHAPTAVYDAAHIASVLSPSAIESDAPLQATDTLLTDAATLARIALVHKFLNAFDFIVRLDSHRMMWRAHEYFDPYRLLTHASSANHASAVQPPSASAQMQERWRDFMQSPDRVTLQLSASLSFASSHVSLSLAEIDMQHNVITSAHQRSAEGMGLAARQPSARDSFLTFVDLSGQEGYGSEFVFWRRHSVNLRARGWGLHLTSISVPSNSNWVSEWKNDVAREQSTKHMDVLEAPQFSDEYTQLFVRMIDLQTRKQGVALALAVTAPRHALTAFSSWTRHRHLLLQLDVGLRCLSKGGSLILQLPDSHSPLALSVLYVLFRCFEQVALHRTAATPYGSAESYAVCKGFHHDRVAQPVSSSPLQVTLHQISVMLPVGDVEERVMQRGFVSAQEMRANPLFVQWIQKYNAIAYAYQLHCVLSLLQPMPSQVSLLDEAAPPSTPAPADAALLPVPPPHHRIRISMLQHLGLPVTDPFAPVESP